MKDRSIRSAIEALPKDIGRFGRSHRQNGNGSAVGIAKLRKCIGHVIDEWRDQIAEKRLVHVHVLPPVAYRATQNAAQDVAAPLVAGHGAVGDGERQTTNMISNHAIGNVDHYLLVRGRRL